jgi:hypothetical protein
VWSAGGTDKLNIAKATVKARLLTDRYPLLGSSTRKRGIVTTCQMCGDAAETLEHFVLDCTALSSARDPMLQELNNAIKPIPDKDQMMKIILDPSWVFTGTVLMKFEKLTRDACFKMYHIRSMRMTGKSDYALAKPWGSVGKGGKQKT